MPRYYFDTRVAYMQFIVIIILFM